MSKIKVIVAVSGGNVQGVRSSDPNVQLEILDYDNKESVECELHQNPNNAELQRQSKYFEKIEAEFDDLEHSIY